MRILQLLVTSPQMMVHCAILTTRTKHPAPPQTPVGLSGSRMGSKWLPADVGQQLNPGVAEALGRHHLLRSYASPKAMWLMCMCEHILSKIGSEGDGEAQPPLGLSAEYLHVLSALYWMNLLSWWYLSHPPLPILADNSRLSWWPD